MENQKPAQNARGDACFLQVGTEVYPVYGSADQGWSVERSDAVEQSLAGYRYRSLDELFFALVNFSFCPVGEA